MAMRNFQTFTYSLNRSTRDFEASFSHDFGFYVDPETAEMLTSTSASIDLSPYLGVFQVTSGGGNGNPVADAYGFALNLADGTYRLTAFANEVWQSLTLTADVDVTIKLSTAGPATLGADFENIFYGGNGEDVVSVAVRLDSQPNRDNFIFLGGGNDWIIGGNGYDEIYGELDNDFMNGGSDAFADLLAGGDGNDTYSLDDGFDTVIELANQGNDTIETIISRTIDTAATANVENLTLFSNGFSLPQNINGTGNALANIIKGNPFANILDGKGGNDTMSAATATTSTMSTARSMS